MAVAADRVESVFAAVVPFSDPVQQAAFLEELCGHEPELKQRVEALLRAHRRTGGVLDRIEGSVQSTIDCPQFEKAGDVVAGRFKLLQRIGEGGMGVVYMAEQSQPVSRRVALKIVKPGMDSKQVLARFEAERQALALMDHQNIAKVFEAGATESGRPYFAMELVKGVPITKYCNEKGLSFKERLELFVPICRAVQHAHQKGVIHRDLKPTNVLIAEYDHKPMPKVIDFGLAKAIGQKLTDKTMFTEFGQIVGTIEYMSREQASFNQLDIDTRTDVYSLGVLLYELLTGTLPFDGKRLRAAGLEAMLKIIREEEPPRLSQRLSASAVSDGAAKTTNVAKLNRRVCDELDWIAMKAMDKERDRRYQTANEFADDVQRYLKDEEVHARPPSTAYRLQKLVKRHRAVFIWIGAMFLVLTMALAGTTKAYLWAREEMDRRDAAVHRADHMGAERTRATRELAAFRERSLVLLDRLSNVASMAVRAGFNDEKANARRSLEMISDLWRASIEAEKDSTGRPTNSAVDQYHACRALCLARLGEHRRASEHAAHLSRTESTKRGWAHQLVRVYALCATSVRDESSVAAVYTEKAIDALRIASDEARVEPPEAIDMELASLTGQTEFRKLLQIWRDNRPKSDAAAARSPSKER